MSDPCDDWWNVFNFTLGKMKRYAIGNNYNPQFDLCDDCTHWVGAHRNDDAE